MTHCRYFLFREKDGETGPASPGLRAVAHPKPASIFIDNPTCDPQAKTSTILTFCGEEWLKNSPPILSRNTRSVVCNENTDAAPCRVSPIPGSYNVQLEVKAPSAFPTRLENTWVISLGKPCITSSESYRFSTIILPDRMA